MVDFFKMFKSKKNKDRFRSADRQINAWKKFNRRMKCGISDHEFNTIPKPPDLNKDDLVEGFYGVVLSYGFGEDGTNHSDAVLSGKLAWDYTIKNCWKKSWQCQYIDFNKTDHFRLRPGAPQRPKGFYFSKLNLGDSYRFFKRVFE